MKSESVVFMIPGVFFLVVAVAYGYVTDFEELVGFPAFLLSSALSFMVAVYFRMLARRHPPRPEDLPDAEISDLSGDQGIYAPWSWWPIVLAFGAALAFVALAVGWWIMVPAAFIGLIGLVGWVFEFSTGRFSH